MGCDGNGTRARGDDDKGTEEPIKRRGGWSKQEHMALIRKRQEHLRRPEERRNLSREAVWEEIAEKIQSRTSSQCSREWRILVIMYRSLKCHFSRHPEQYFPLSREYYYGCGIHKHMDQDVFEAMDAFLQYKVVKVSKAVGSFNAFSLQMNLLLYVANHVDCHV
ncbi:hypothetical protein SELMODRAFT_408663 [Selaginella moellendorffii]|uniref:Myb-like domain-containing protein n=1 Tax=Selaginella moellendorffii TaxID=88036 RepID=D8R9J2_SELML|nr:hypothetical protein SELMODRAFT_408663 [Selaginella moellendorffii]